LYSNGFSDSGDDEVEARFDLDRSLACSAQCFFLRASGNGLRESGILDGDLILVDPCEDYSRSDMVVYDCAGTIELRTAERAGPASANGGPVAYPENGGSALRYLGVARAVVRTLSRK
jgi:DNA polymerase V